MARPKKYSDELRRRALEEVLERGRKIPEVASQLGIGSPETLRKWVRLAEADRGLREAPTTEELADIKKLCKEAANSRQRLLCGSGHVREYQAYMVGPKWCIPPSRLRWCEDSAVAGGSGIALVEPPR